MVSPSEPTRQSDSDMDKTYVCAVIVRSASNQQISIPITLSRKKPIQPSALINCRAEDLFVNETVNLEGRQIRKLRNPIIARNADGTVNKREKSHTKSNSLIPLKEEHAKIGFTS
jgi:hypothetical protein